MDTLNKNDNNALKMDVLSEKLMNQCVQRIA